MFVYFSLAQVRNQAFRGPDFFVVLDVSPRERKSWVVWQEGKGSDVVIELLSDSTSAHDKGEQKIIYQNALRVLEYYWFDPFSGEWAGFILHHSRYAESAEDSQGCLISAGLGLALVHWEGIYQGITARWLRWAMVGGTLPPIPKEVAIEAQQQAAAVPRQAESMAALLACYRERFGALPE